MTFESRKPLENGLMTLENGKIQWKEFDGFIAVEKPAGIATVRERNLAAPCLFDRISNQIGKKLWIVHRLDKDVSGIVIFACNAKAHRDLSMMFEHKNITKQYSAIVHGKVEEPGGTIDAPIRQFGSGRMGIDETKGKPSQTGYDVVAMCGRFSQLNLYPQTGRRHQLRVHLYHIGHPIVGDPMYGDKKTQAAYPRLMLHACRVKFEWRGELVSIESPLPGEWKETMEGNREG